MKSLWNELRKKDGKKEKSDQSGSPLKPRGPRVLSRSGLCEACTRIDPYSKYPSTHHIAAYLRKSAETCSMCRYINKHFSGARTNRSAEVSVDLVKANLRYRVPTDGGGSQTVFEIFKTSGTPLASSNGSVCFRSVSPDSMSHSALEIVRSWLDNCNSSHEACSREPSFSLPTRVIDVTGRRPCLREIHQVNVPYVTLSHCWGDKPTLTTSKSTFPAHAKGITMSNMPQTFQDAVVVTKRLGISYLWIDSLCIIQDSMEDWAAECPKMKGYYRNSFVTISALESSDSHQGFLAPRNSSDNAQLPKISNAWIRPGSLPRAKVFQDARLNHRGWALQERLISTCVLHFTKQEMFWECQTCSARESSMAENRGATNFHLLVSSEGEDFKRSLATVGPDKFSHEAGSFDFWMRLVRQFSRRSLTFPSDKLPAISGLAAVLAMKTKSKYMAGLWEDDLHGLAWFKDGPSERVIHETMEENQVGYLAPSWSWICMSESITYRFNDENRVTSIRDPTLVTTVIETRDSDPFGCISSCSLRIQALTKPVQCMVNGGLFSYQNHIFGFVDSNYRTYGSFDALPVYIFAEDGTPVGTGSFDEKMEDSVSHICKAVRVAERSYTRYSHIGDAGNPQDNGGRHFDQNVVYFLLVQPDENVQGAWKRVGAGMTRDFVSRLHYGDFFDVWDWEQLQLT